MGPRKRFTSYDEIVQHYLWNGRLKGLEEIEWMRKASGLREAVELAAGSRQDNGRLFFHQRWLDADDARRGLEQLLVHITDVDAANDFDLLLRLVGALVGHLDGLKEMYVYDVTFRVGVFKNVWPVRVYLHRGTREGAVAMGFDGKRQSIEVDEFPEAFRLLEPYEIENLLCSHKDDLAHVRRLLTAAARKRP